MRAFERGESPKQAEQEHDIDHFGQQLLSRAPGGAPGNFYRAAIEDTTIITMKGVSRGSLAESSQKSDKEFGTLEAGSITISQGRAESQLVEATIVESGLCLPRLKQPYLTLVVF